MPITVHNYSQSPKAGGKFVVLVQTDNLESGVVLFSDFNQDTQHMHIVRRYERTSGRTLLDSGLAVRGGGWWRVEDGVLILYGNSVAYGRFDPKWLKKYLKPGTVHGEAAIIIE